MKHLKILTIGVLVSFFIVGGFVVNNYNKGYAQSPSRFEKLQANNNGYEERAKAIGINDVKQVEIQRPANKDAKVKPVESLEGVVKEQDLKDGVTYKEKEVLTYEEFLNKYTMFDYNPEISKDRKIWVIVSKHPKGVTIDKGNVENAEVIRYYDAETGEFYGFRLFSKDKQGNHISKEVDPTVNVKKPQ